jgi:integrase
MAAKQPGITVRHKRTCPSRTGGKCPSKEKCITYEARVWSKEDEKQISKTFSGQGALGAAKGWRIDALSEVKNGKQRASTGTTVAQAAETWLEAANDGSIRKPDGERYKPSVLRQYESDLERYLLPLLGSMQMSNLRRRDLQRVVDRLVGLGLSGSRVRGAVMPLRAICRRAIRSDEIAVNPTADLELPAANGTRNRVASDDERDLLIETLPDADQALWATAFYAGLRRGELRALRDEDVDLDANVIHVRHGWDDVKGEIDPKSKKGARDVPVGDVLRRYLLERRARTGRRGSDLFFGRTAREPFTPSNVRKRALEAWAVAAVGAFLTRQPLPVELEPIGLHECRHTYVSWMHEMGFNLENIGDYVGHSSTYMTDTYRHLRDGHLSDAVDIMDAYHAERTRGKTRVQSHLAVATPHG